MSDDVVGTAAQRFEVSGRVDTHFSWIRTRMSLERTLMSWIRTGTALIGFGFTIFQFLERFNATPGVARADLPRAPQLLGLSLIAAGIGALIISIVQYGQAVRYLWDPQFASVAGFREKAGTTPVIGVAILLTVVGLFAFVAVLLRLN